MNNGINQAGPTQHPLVMGENFENHSDCQQIITDGFTRLTRGHRLLLLRNVAKASPPAPSGDYVALGGTLFIAVTKIAHILSAGLTGNYARLIAATSVG